MIEFALVVILFLVFLFGIIDWCWAFFQQQTIMWGASEAARWASARKIDQATIQNIVFCGSPTCTGSATGLYQNATVTAQAVALNDQIDSLTTVTRYYVKVTVSGYQMSLITPMFARSYTGRPIVAVQPMECQLASNDCTDWMTGAP